ncbi:protein phosphatase 2C domain-containing protein [Macellibacteroides fermentans]|uniref:protein phosphatase 2C domain-containing protein n=1 Tax=Macellibacteroides fermentans TaxID=879969 RepID=UPI00406C4E60
MISKEERRDNLIFVTVSDIGSNHRILCMPNQDAIGFNYIGEDFVIVVSDGVGSCKEADIGSKYVVDAVKQLFSSIKSRTLQFDNYEIADAIISYWRISIGNNPIDDYCATVKAALKVGNTVKIISLGDGIAAISSNGISLIAPTEETNFTNETKCMSSFVSPASFWIGDFHLDTYEPFAVLCCTDGVANGLVLGKEVELLNEIERNTNSEVLKEELENLIKEIGDYSFDDKTVGVVKYERKN